MTKKTLLTLGAAASVAVATLVPAGIALAAGPAASEWTIGPFIRGRNQSVGMPLTLTPGPRGTAHFDFPIHGQGSVHYVTADTAPLAGARAITLKYRIDAAPGTRFVPTEAPDRQALLSLYFQRAGDRWTMKYPAHRWYSPVNRTMPLTPGVHTVRIDMREPWIAMVFKDNRELPGGFEAALRETQTVGFVFGYDSGRGHGVGATGPARFTVLDFRVE